MLITPLFKLLRIRKLKQSVCTCITIVSFYIALVYFNPMYSANKLEWQKTGAITYFNDIYLPQKTVKKIVVWTNFFLKPRDFSGDRTCLSTCDVKCEITDDKREADDADAIEFHLTDVWSKFWSIGTKSTIEFPKSRKPHQVWILFNLEPPTHMFGDLEIFNGLFNWTRWYRQDSDVPSPYGYRQELSAVEKKKRTQELKERNFFKEKSKDMFLTISNCFDRGQRYKLVDQLDRHFIIDKFGKCYGGKTCETSDCDLKQYKFHLAFENDHCTDYVTEKYWRTLDRDQIPIVNWKYGHFKTAIPNSYINIYDFNNLNEAIEYIKAVNIDESLYNSYFEYKVKYKNEAPVCSMCTTCRALHNSSRRGQVYTDMESWIRDDKCDKIQMSGDILRNVNGFLFYWLGISW